MLTDIVGPFQNFVLGLPELFQWLGVMLIAAVPFIESYFGSAVGVIAGIHPVAAIVSAVVGNIISMLIFVFVASGIRSKATSNHTSDTSPKRQKIKNWFDKFGVAGVSLIGQILLPSQITSGALVSFGVNRNAVIFWQIISIILWGVVFGVIATLGLSIIS